jgi:hypothetical protein
MSRRFLTVLVWLTAALGLAGSAQATPVVYNFMSGTLTLSASDSAGPVFSTSSPPVVPLTGTQVTFDAATGNLSDFNIVGGPSAPISMTGNLTGETLVISNVSALPGPGYGNISPPTGSNPYFISVGPLATSSTLTGTGLVNFGPTVKTNTPAAASGQMQIGGDGTLTLTGITFATLNFATVGTVTVKADVVFSGVVPEPSTALLLGSGLLAMGASVRRRGRS